jgi:hypothetical protein
VLLENEAARDGMRRDLAEVADRLSGPDDPLEVAAALIENRLTEKQSKEEVVHVS